LRFATVTSYKFQLVRYDSSGSGVGMSQNRVRDTIGEEFRFNWFRQNSTFLVEYRFEAMEYDNNASGDSTTHFALVGIDEAFSPQLKATVRGGATFRSYTNGGGQTDPHFEASLGYTGAHHASVAWTSSYGIEAPSSGNALSRTTFRTGLRLKYGITERISATLDGFYHHDDNRGGTSGTFSADAFDLSVGVHSVINRRFTFDLGAQRSEVSSGEASQNYSRNRYFAGLTFNF